MLRGVPFNDNVTGPGGMPIFYAIESPGGMATDSVGFPPDEAFPADEPGRSSMRSSRSLAIDVSNKCMHPIVDLLVRMDRYVWTT